MFVGYSAYPAGSSDEVEKFAHRRTFPEVFSDAVTTSWNVLVDDDYLRPQDEGTLDASRSLAYIFYAKDKQTLKDGLRACPPGVKISGGTTQLGFFTKRYDFEKLAGWGRARHKGDQQWGTLNNDQRGRITRKRFDMYFNRLRLKERGYMVLVCRSFALPLLPDVVKLIGAEISLNALGSMLSNRMTREQAVGRLMDDLLVA